MSDSLIVRSSLKENFSVLPNELINDDRLSTDHLGLLVYLLSKPNDWQVRVKQLQNRFDMGRDKTRRILATLEQYGYISRDIVRAEGKFSETRYIVKDSPEPENPSPEKPAPVNPTLTKNRSKQRTESTKSNKGAKQKLTDWQPTDQDRQYATDLGLDAEEILTDIRLWDEKNGFKAAYASCRAFWQGWCRKEGKRTQRRSNRQQSVCKTVLSDKQKQYAETVAEKMWNAYKAEGFYYQPILTDILAFMATDQTDADWLAIGNGLDNPIDRGWM